MKALISILLGLVLFCGCGPQRRLARLLERHPELRTTDTITLSDTIPLCGVRADTSVPLAVIRDSVVVEKERLQVVVRKVRDTLYIRGKCKPDTVVIRRRIPVERIHIIRPDLRSALIGRIPWMVAALVAVFVMAIYLLSRFGRR